MNMKRIISYLDDVYVRYMLARLEIYHLLISYLSRWHTRSPTLDLEFYHQTGRRPCCQFARLPTSSFAYRPRHDALARYAGVQMPLFMQARRAVDDYFGFC